MTSTQAGSVFPQRLRQAPRLAPKAIDYALACAATLLLALVLIALMRGAAHRTIVPASVWFHLITVGGALALSPVMLLRRRGDRIHRVLGWLWVVLLMAAAIVSFDIRNIIRGHLSPIHAVSAFVIIETPMIVWFARRHDVRGHGIAVRSTIAGALLIAGFFTLLPGRMLGGWLFGRF